MSALEELAVSQWGLFTTAQASHYGVQRNQILRLAEKGRAEMLTYGVYRMTSGDETVDAEIKAAWMSIFPKERVAERMKKSPRDAVVAGRTAAYMYGVGDFYASPYTFIVPNRKQTTRDDMKYLLWELDEQDITFVHGLPVTTIERTIADLVRLHEDPEHLNTVIVDMAQKKLDININRLAYLLSPLAARNGYPKNDGDAFARTLLKSSMAIWLAHISSQFNDIEKIYASLDSIKNLSTSLKIASSILATSISLPDIHTFNNALTMNIKESLDPIVNMQGISQSACQQLAEQINAIIKPLTVTIMTNQQKEREKN